MINNQEQLAYLSLWFKRKLDNPLVIDKDKKLTSLLFNYLFYFPLRSGTVYRNHHEKLERVKR